MIAIAPATRVRSSTTLRTNALVLAKLNNRQASEGPQRQDDSPSPALTRSQKLLAVDRKWWAPHTHKNSKNREIPLFQACPRCSLSDRIDGARVVEPFIGAARKSGRVLAYGFDGISKHFINATWFADPGWANMHADTVSRFASAMRVTAIWANENQAKSGELRAKYTKIDPASVAAMARVHYPEQMTAALMQPLIDASAKYRI